MKYRELKCGELKTMIFKTRSEMGAFAAKEAAAYIRALGEVKEEINILFAAAPSQDDFLSALIQEKGVPWDKVVAMQLDDYIHIDVHASQRFANYLNRHIFSHVLLKQCLMIDCTADDIEAELARYTQILKEHPADISFIGIGENGHIAFNDPGKADFSDPEWIKIVSLDLESRVQQVNDGCFESLDQVPKMAMTVTIPPIMKAKRIFCIVPGETKAEAVKNTLTADINCDVPSTILRKHEHAVLYAEEASAMCI